jgi:DNA helicase II / ATP-dependent DNA helicase PcrA
MQSQTATAAIALITAFKGFAPSPMQGNVITFIVDGKGSAIVDAVAGAGKTATIEMSLLAIPESQCVTLIAFSKLIADELNARIAKLRAATGRAFANVKASTFHSVAYGVCARNIRGFRKANTRKLIELVERKFTPEDADTYGAFARQLVGYARGEGIGAIVADTESAWFALVDHHCMMLDSEDASEARGVELARQLLKDSNEAAKAGNIDFDDMLYIPLLMRWRFWQNDFVFVDEAQDTNPVRRAIIRLLLKPQGRLIAVGDPRQAIFGFTGASHDSLDLIARDFNTVTLPLSVCYRCSAAVVDHAAEIVPHISAAPNAAAGRVATLTMADAGKVLTASDAILCRNTAPLVKLAYSLIKSGTGCKVLGRDIGANLVALVKGQKARDLASLAVKLAAYLDRETTRFNAKGEESKVAAITDRVECVFAIIESCAATDGVADLIRRIEGMFCADDDSRPLLTLATVHKAKGKEYPQVAILAPELMPSKFARQAWQQLQETNLMYVARTRAMESLYYLAA